MDWRDYPTTNSKDAVAWQKELRKQVQLQPVEGEIRFIAGADVSCNMFSRDLYAGIVVLSFPDMEVVESLSGHLTNQFPYRTGLLAFRELPSVMQHWEQLKQKPDVVLFDGHGIMHPRRMGIATHFGLLTETPTIGVGKTRLWGKVTEPGIEKFNHSWVMDKDEVLGAYLRTKRKCRPLFISPGHLISVDQSLDLVKRSVKKFRLPEPTRLAHELVNFARKKHLGIIE